MIVNKRLYCKVQEKERGDDWLVNDIFFCAIDSPHINDYCLSELELVIAAGPGRQLESVTVK